MQLDQKELMAAKAELDKTIKRVNRLADLAEKRALDCCGGMELDMRDDLEDLAGELRIAQGHLRKARSLGGRLDGAGLTRGGGT